MPALTKEFGYKNPMAVPKIEKISINIGLGEATQNAKLMDGAVNELGQIAGQKPVITKAHEVDRRIQAARGQAIGCMVTLRGDRMFEFFDRLVNVALPRVRDFRGVSTKCFDGRGNYTLGIKDQLIFPEIDYAKVDKTKGMNISITTTARTDAEGLALLSRWGCRSGSKSETSRGISAWPLPPRSPKTSSCKIARISPRRRKPRRRNSNAGIGTAAGAAAGRARFLRKFGICRLCFRQLALNGEIPGVIKASW